MPSKNILKSKTAWVNLLLAIIVAVGSPAVFNIPILQDPQVIGYVTAGVNVILRLISSGEVTVLPKA